MARRRVVVGDLPLADRPVMLVWAKCLWRCAGVCDPDLSEETEEIAPRAMLTERARAETSRGVGPAEPSVAQAAGLRRVVARGDGRSARSRPAPRRSSPPPRRPQRGRARRDVVPAGTAQHPTVLVTGIIQLDEAAWSMFSRFAVLSR
jgi:hypothetical protein